MVLQALVIGHGRVVTAGQLAEAVWGDAEPPSWATQVQICVAHPRRRLSGAAIETVGNGYRLAVDGDEVDVYAIGQLVRRGRQLLAAGEPDRATASLTRALELWRGEPYDDLDGWEPGTTESARLSELLLSTEEDLAEARLALGQHRAVASDAESLVARQPLPERRWALVPVALYRSGRQADAFPDDPDPSTDSLPDVVATASSTAAEWLGVAVGAIDSYLAGTADPRFDEVLERNLKISSLSSDHEASLRLVIRAELDAVRRSLIGGVVDVVPQTGEEWRVTVAGDDYGAAILRVGQRLSVSPPFRNALTANERAARLIGLMVGVDGRIRDDLAPITRRYERLNDDQATVNRPWFASFAFEIATGAFATFPHVATWPEVHFRGRHVPDRRAVGWVDWRDTPRAGAGVWEIGVLIVPEERGRGAASAAQSRLVDDLFANTPAHRVWAGT